MLENVLDAVLKIRNGVGIPVPELDVVLFDATKGAVYGREVVLLDVGVVTPAAELIAVMKSNGELDACSINPLANVYDQV